VTNEKQKRIYLKKRTCSSFFAIPLLSFLAMSPILSNDLQIPEVAKGNLGEGAKHRSLLSAVI